jgi:hypothetical protein
MATTAGVKEDVKYKYKHQKTFSHSSTLSKFSSN